MISFQTPFLSLLISSIYCTFSPLLIAETLSQAALIEDLFTTHTTKEFNQTLALASKKNVAKQIILEARFIHYVNQADNHALAELSKELLPLQNAFDPHLSQIFTLEDDWKAIVKYTVALANLELGNATAFESNIKQAFWLSPRQATAFAPHVERFKLALAMESVQILPELTQSNLLTDKDEKIIEPKNNINILFFWSPWSREFTETVDDFTALCNRAKKHDILIRTIIAEQSNEVNQDAIGFINESKLNDSALWLKEDPSFNLSTALRIQSIPTVILIDKHGKIQFNGHPSSPEFSTTLDKYLAPSKLPHQTPIE